MLWKSGKAKSCALRGIFAEHFLGLTELSDRSDGLSAVYRGIGVPPVLLFRRG